MTLPLTLAARYMNGRRLRTVLTTLAVVFGVLLTFGVNTILPAIGQAFRANLLAVAGQVDLTATHKAGTAFPIDVLDRVGAVDGILAVSGSLNRTVNLPADYFDGDPAQRDQLTALALVGIEPEAAQSLRAYPVVTGRFLQAGDGTMQRDEDIVLAPVRGKEPGGIAPIPRREARQLQRGNRALAGLQLGDRRPVNADRVRGILLVDAGFLSCLTQTSGKLIYVNAHGLLPGGDDTNR